MKTKKNLAREGNIFFKKSTELWREKLYQKKCLIGYIVFLIDPKRVKEKIHVFAPAIKNVLNGSFLLVFFSQKVNNLIKVYSHHASSHNHHHLSAIFRLNDVDRQTPTIVTRVRINSQKMLKWSKIFLKILASAVSTAHFIHNSLLMTFLIFKVHNL